MEAMASDSSTISSSTPKTPVSVLQEVYVKRGITPKYDLVQIEGQVHEPTFKYRVTVGEFVATGSGQSKKKAKHNAARAVLERMKQAQAQSKSASGVDSVVATLKDLDISTTEVTCPEDDGIEGNPVGELQELCMNRKMPPPAYDVSLEEGQPHERKFVMVCSVGKQQESGTGKSKKLAKRLAAHGMLKRLKSQPVESDQDPFRVIDDDDLAQGIAQRSRELKAKNAHHLIKFFKGLKVKQGPTLTKLHSKHCLDLDDDPCSTLEAIALEEDFSITYVPLEEKSRLGLYNCLVQLSTLPVAVCYGSGVTREKAQEASAINALEYLAIMTK